MKILLLISSLLFLASCSHKAGVTSSKIKIISGNLQALLSTKANNGLLLFGKSSDGKTFTKAITTESVDLVFPNGIWNFYAISWELMTASAFPNFQGKTYCGKLVGQNLAGADVSLSINLTNTNCADADFSAYTFSASSTIATTGASESLVNFPSPYFFTCKDLGPVKTSSGAITSCDQVATANFNKGYLTSYKIVAYEYKNFGLGDSTGPSKVFESSCVRSSFSSSSGGIQNDGLNDPSYLTTLKIPVNSNNGLAIAIEAYYSNNACNPESGFDVFPIAGNNRSLGFSPAAGKYNLFMQTTEADVCSGPRLAPDKFAAGYGEVGSPYAICTKEQFNRIGTGANFGSLANNSFQLLSDLNFNFGPFVPIGDSLSATASTLTAFTGNFDGRGKRLENIKLPCDQFTNYSSTNFSMGIFRKTHGSKIGNFTVNKIVGDCKDKKVTNVGAIVGEAYNTSLNNINIFGFLAADKVVGGAVGLYSLDASAIALNAQINDINAELSIEGVQRIGGLVGVYNAQSSAVAGKIFRSSVKGELHSNLENGNSYLGACSIVNNSISNSVALGAFCQIQNTTNTAMSVNGFTVAANSSIYAYSNGISWFNAGSNSSIPFDSFIGGLIGEVNGSPTNSVFIDQVALYLSSGLEGSRYIGGFFGIGKYVNLSNTSISGVLKSNTETDGVAIGRGFVNMGGIAGLLTNAYVSNGLIALYYAPRLSFNNTTANIPGTIYGVTGGGSTTASTIVLQPSTSLGALGFISPANNGGNFATDLNVRTNYNTTWNMINKYGTGSPSANLAGVSGDEYINLADGSCSVYAASVGWSGPSACSKIWVMPDENFDSPRLAWEVAAQSKVPYLKRECSGLYAIQSGDGSATNPKSICSIGQFQEMVSGNYYTLKKSLIGDGADRSTPLKATPGVYHLEGNRYSISNLNFIFSNSLSGNYGMFSELQAGSSVSNLNFSFIGIHPPASSNIVGNTAMGILAGVNNGVLSNIRFENSRMDLDAPYWSAQYTARFGALVGFNDSFGVLQNIQSNIALKMLRPYPNFSSYLIAGGLVGTNYGKINEVRVNGELARMLGEMRDPNPSVADLNLWYSCANHPGVYVSNSTANAGAFNGDYFCYPGAAGSSYPGFTSSGGWNAISRLSANETWGGVVGVNRGWLSEIQYEGSMTIRDFSDNTAGVVAPFIGRNIVDSSMTNSGVISDIKYNGRFDSNKSPISLFMPTEGTYNRLVLTPQDLQGVIASANFIPTGATHSICASYNTSFLTTQCLDRSKISAEYTNMGLTFKDTSTVISGLDNMTDWNLSTGFLPDMTKTWKLHGQLSSGVFISNDLPDLMKGDGDFSDIGKGF